MRKIKLTLEEKLPRNSPPHSPRIESALEDRPGELVVDMKNKKLLYVDELNYLVDVYNRVNAYGGRIRILNPSETVKKELSLCRMEMLFGVY